MATLKYYIMNKEEDAYYIDFDNEYRAKEWLKEQTEKFPEYVEKNGYHIVEKKYVSYTDELINLLQEAVEEIESCYGRDTELIIKIRNYINEQ